MAIRETSITFPTTRGSGPRLGSTTVVFPRAVTNAVAAIRGYQVGFVGEDHHVGLLQVQLSTEVNANVVIAHGTLGCRDWSGNWDDEYNGSIQVTIFAELEPAGVPPARDDLQITDLEVTQATQFFRSAEHLDAANVMPDNSMPLIGGKATGVRLYVDHDPGAGVPIARLSGELEVRSGGVTTVLTALVDIVPRRATEVDRAQVDHTLNFAIPAAWCRGRLDIRCRVFDASDPGPRSSAFQRTLQFLDVNPLRIYGVGIDYTGMGLNLPAPTLAALDSTFDFTRKVWPTGEILTSGFTTMAFNQNLAGNAANGCGSGFNALLDQLKDIKGDTDDLVYGVLPTGTPLTGVGGCGGGGAGVGMVGGGVTAAHEAGHAVGRKHAPCDDATRCDSPQNTDDDYPVYGNYVSDSIGEFGFDPSSNVVHDPATRRDFMGYSGNDWISPYTYRALMAKGDPQPYTPSAKGGLSLFMQLAASAPAEAVPGARRAEWIRRRQPLIHLSVYVNGKNVTLKPSFTFPAYLRRPGPDADYEVHLEDEEGHVLACVTLQQACGACDAHCGPLALQGEVPWENAASHLTVRREGEELARYEIEEPPKLSVDGRITKQRDIEVSWRVAGGSEPLWYLVQWQDFDGSWRGVAPRTQEERLVVPGRYLWATKDRLKLRVLAVHLLHTASEEVELKAHENEPPTRVDVEELAGGGGYRAVVRDPLGRALPGDDLVWHDETGAELARGSVLDLASARRRGIATVRRLGQGVTGSEGFVLHDPASGKVTCGCRPSGRAARQAMEAGQLHPDLYEKGSRREDS